MRKLFLLVLLLPCIAAAQNTSETQNPFHWTGAIAAGKTLAIKNVSGDVKVEATSGTEAEVTATRHGEDSAAIRIQVVPSSDGVAICAIFPQTSSSCDSSTEWQVHQHGNNHNERVDFVVRMPRDARLLVRNVNGEVRATGLGEVADATTVNGSVDVETAAWAHLMTVNGEIKGRFGRADWPDTLKLTTVNGDINLDVPADLSADVEFSCVNGSLESDLPITISSSSGRFGPKHMRGTIGGGGGRQLKLSTVNGSANLHKNTM